MPPYFFDTGPWANVMAQQAHFAAAQAQVVAAQAQALSQQMPPPDLQPVPINDDKLREKSLKWQQLQVTMAVHNLEIPKFSRVFLIPGHIIISNVHYFNWFLKLVFQLSLIEYCKKLTKLV